MATVLIAEDEYLVRVGLRTCIDWQANGFTLLEDAINGEDAYQRILEHHPDILLLDIKMPRINGFELLERLSKEGICLSTIILSCCDDFESVRTALHYGVIDYLNKLTLNATELLRVLNKVPRDTARPQESSVPRDKPALWPETIFEKLVTGKPCPSEELKVLFDRGYVAYLLFTSQKPDQLPAPTVLLNMITQQFKGCGVACVSCCEEAGSIALLLPAQPGMDHLVERLHQRLNTILDASCALGLSGLYEGPGEILERLIWAKQIRHCTYWGLTDVFRIYSARLDISQPCRARFLHLREEVHNSLLAQSRETTISALQSFLKEFSHLDCIAPDSYIQFCLSMLKLFSLEPLENSYFICQQTIMKSETAAEANTALLSFARQGIETACFFGNGHDSPIVKKVIQYVLLNPDRIIQLSEAAQHANVSESYLSQLFKKETGENYISYIHRYKINLAKEMLDGPMLVYEVCAQVGFENANYFSKIFRRYTGCTPSEFKKAGKAGLP